MKFMGGIGAAVLLLSVTASAQVTLSGDVPYRQIPELQQYVDRIWQHEAETYLLTPKTMADIPAPRIEFYEFERADESANWVVWQKNWIRDNPAVWLDWTKISGIPESSITKEWIDQHIDTLFPFPVTFLAFHYDHTNRIQVSPSRTFLRFYQNDPYGFKRETVGYGFYTATHEMLHYVLEQDGIPGPLHHCLFISEKNGHSLMGDLTQYLIDQNISAPLVESVGFDAEKSMMPCEALTDQERALVQKYLNTSKIWNREELSSRL